MTKRGLYSTYTGGIVPGTRYSLGLWLYPPLPPQLGGELTPFYPSSCRGPSKCPTYLKKQQSLGVEDLRAMIMIHGSHCLILSEAYS